MNIKLLLFVLIVFTLYISANIYLFVRGYQSLPTSPTLRLFYTITFAILSLSFIVVMLGEGKLPNVVVGILHPVASTWLAAMLYLLMLVVIFDLLRVGNHFFTFFPDFITTNYAKTKLIALLASVSVVVVLCSIGYYRFTHPTVTQLELSIPKKMGDRHELRIAFASDIHLGHFIRNNQLKKYVEQLNSLNPDVVLIAGDIIDRDLNFVIKSDIGKEFKNLNAPMGVYAVLGNHEYISQHVDRALQYLEESGITMLRDSIALIDNSFYVVGRDDRSNPQRKHLSALIDTINQTLPLILLDHQPAHLHEAENAGIDLQLSGHTHYGQMFPLNYITEKVYEVAYGHKRKGNTHVYVSSGLGLWGPPFRIGTKSEIVEIVLKFE